MVHKWVNEELEIIRHLFNNESHVRAIEKAINIPHTTLIRRLSELEKKNAVDYKIIGKNKQYFIKKNLMAKKLLETSENYALLKLLDKYPFFEPLFEDIIKKCKSKLIILFGSYAKYASNKESDIDIYVETNSLAVKQTAESINSKISAKIGKFDVNSLLIKEIIKNHIIIKGVEEFYDNVFG